MFLKTLNVDITFNLHFLGSNYAIKNIYIYIFANFIDRINSHKEVQISTFLIKVFIYGPHTTCILHNFQI